MRKRPLRIAVLYRKIDPRYRENFPADLDGREEDDGYLSSIVKALRRAGHDPFYCRITEDRLQDLVEIECDVAFNLVEEGLNNDSRLEPHLPALLDVYGIPYTGGDYLALAITADKARAKEVLSHYGIPTPRFQILRSAAEERRPDLPFPLICKPLHEDASIGVFRDSVVYDDDALRRQVRRILRRHRQPAIAEEYVEGRELSVGVIEQGPRKLVTPMNEVVFNTPPGVPRVYTYPAKWDDASEEYDTVIPDQCPAEGVPAGVESEIRELAVRSFEVLRLRGYARVDFRLPAGGRPLVLEINANPLIGEGSVMAVMAEEMGWSFSRFISAIAIEAHRRARRERRRVTVRDLVRAPAPGA